MQLIEGVKLDIRKSIDKQSVMINNGAIKEINIENNDVEYLENSFTPIDKWIELDEYNKRILFDNAKNQESFNKIVIDEIPENIKEILIKLKINESNDRDEVFSKFAENPELTLDFENKTTAFLNNFAKSNNSFELYKILVLYPNRKTTALLNFNDKTKFLGLHFDSCTTFEIETANESKNRFCINMGSEDRELYFVNLSLVQIKQLILEANSRENITLKNLTLLFFKYYFNYPITKVKIKPFQFYIAPTDNCIHEGTTFRKNKIDISITYLGYFNKI